MSGYVWGQLFEGVVRSQRDLGIRDLALSVYMLGAGQLRLEQRKKHEVESFL